MNGNLFLIGTQREHKIAYVCVAHIILDVFK